MLVRIAGLAAVMLSLGSLCVGGNETRSPEPSVGGDTACVPLRNVDSILVAGRITLFGELHGTEQMPAFVGNVLCHAWKRHVPTTLALELASESSPRFDAFVHSASDSLSARAELLADSVWREDPPDGRTSQAMLLLLERARSFSRAGADVRVILFSRPSTPTRDSTMAAELSRAIASEPSRVVVVLTGNIHSRVGAGTASDSSFRPMGLRLRDLVRPRRVVGLDASYQSGTAWVCLTDGTPCGAHSLSGRGVVPPDDIELGPLEKRYDGLFGVGAIVASPPALRDGSGR